MKPECWNSFQTNLAIQYSTRVDWSYIDRKIFFFHAPAFEQDRIWSLCQKNDLKMGSQNFLIFNAVCVPVKIFNLHIEMKCKIGIFCFIVSKKILSLSFEFEYCIFELVADQIEVHFRHLLQSPVKPLKIWIGNYLWVNFLIDHYSKLRWYSPVRSFDLSKIMISWERGSTSYLLAI